MAENKPPQHEEFDPITQDKFVPHHEFDGIRELDNEPPYWLSILFIVTVLFAYTYFAKFHIFKMGDLQEEKYRKEMAKYEPEQEESAMALLPRKSAEPLVPLTAESRISSGKEVFKTNCAVCHLEQGQGLVGPNLTDKYWIHGGSYEDIVEIIVEGVPAKGMISWKTQLPREKILEVASYIMTLRGTNPPNPKEPEGEEYIPEEE